MERDDLWNTAITACLHLLWRTRSLKAQMPCRQAMVKVLEEGLQLVTLGHLYGPLVRVHGNQKLPQNLVKHVLVNKLRVVDYAVQKECEEHAIVQHEDPPLEVHFPVNRDLLEGKVCFVVPIRVARLHKGKPIDRYRVALGLLEHAPHVSHTTHWLVRSLLGDIVGKGAWVRVALEAVHPVVLATNKSAHGEDIGALSQSE